MIAFVYLNNATTRNHRCLATKKAVRLDCLSCGGRTRTCDLQVMSLASYQLLHSAMYFL